MSLKEDFIAYSSQEKGACHAMQGHMGKTRFHQEEERSEVKAWDFFGKGRAG